MNRYKSYYDSLDTSLAALGYLACFVFVLLLGFVSGLAQESEIVRKHIGMIIGVIAFVIVMVVSVLAIHFRQKPQHQVSPYRVDFASPEKHIVIELDGHGYHKIIKQRNADAK